MFFYNSLLPISFILLSLIPSISSGTFSQPSNVDAIVQSIANKDEYSDYTFNIIPNTQIPKDGTLEITFPTQFSLGLGINIDPNFNTYCNVPCSIANYVVTFEIISSPCLPGVTSAFTIYSVLNPPNKGGTGNFIIRSKKGINILDENLVYGIVGIADSIKNLTSTTVALDSTGSTAAGILTKYSFSFKTNQIIPQNSYFLLTVPSVFSISKSPSCATFAINGNIISGQLSCTSQGKNVIIRGLADDIPASFEVGISVSLTNPTVSGTTDTFRLAILRTNTNVVYAWRTGITGVTITPGSIMKIVFSQINPILIAAMNKYMDYRIQFIPKNALPLGSQIHIKFPMQMISNCHIEYGIEDIDENNPTTLTCNSLSSSLLISGQQAIENPGEISLTVRMQNPNVHGITTPVKIYTYKDASETIIDQDITSATTTIQDIPSTTLSASAVTLSGNYEANSLISTFNFLINPSLTVPPKGYIQIVVPNAFTIGQIISSSCLIGGSNAFSCTKTDQVVLMRLTASMSLNVGSTSSFSLNNLITKPVYEGDFLFDITTYNSDGATILDSYSMTLIITPNPLSTVSYLLIGNELNKKGIFLLDFKTKLAINSGLAQTKVTDIKGIIQLKFTGWATDLGTGLSDNSEIPCTSSYGILPIDDLSIGCYLRIRGINAFIEIRNFQSLATGTICRIYFPNILIASGNVDLNLIKKYNRVSTILNTYSSTPSTNANVAKTFGSSSSVYTISNSFVSNVFNLQWNLELSQNVVAGDSLLVKLPTFDKGFIQDVNMVTCFIGVVGSGPTAHECIKFTIIDWILIKMPIAIPSSTSIFLSLRNLKWPRYAYSLGVPSYLVHYTANKENHLKRYQNLNAPNFQDFYSSAMNIPKKGKGYPDCGYYFKFKATNSIPNGGTVTLTFPSDYSLQSSFPSPTFSADQFTGYNSNPLVFTPLGNILTISNIAEFPEKSLFTITVKGIQNPSPLVSTSTGWMIQTSYNGYTINERSNFDFFQYGNAYSPGTIIFNSISAFPQNALVLADYSIEFTPNTAIPALGIISITFPTAQFNNMPSNPSCKISGGLQTFSSCSLSGTIITIVTDSEYTTGSLIVTIKDIINPAAGTTDGFEIITFYDNNFLDLTDDTDDSYRTILILPQAFPITVNSIDFEPKNEGERAKYTFEFIPTSNLKRDMELMIQFPDNYDDLIGSRVKCEGLAGIQGGFTVSILQKKLFITGLEAYTPSNDNPLILVVYNVINPNRISNIGKFRIATFSSNSKIFIDYNEDINGFEMVSSAGWLTIFNISATNYYSRLTANYTINFTLSKILPKAASEGYILIDFPTQFDIPDKIISCSNIPTTFGNLTSILSQNRVYATGNPESFIGNLMITFNLIDNPPLSGLTNDLTVITYDGFNKYIIERSFPNLDPFSFEYSYSGPLIVVNDDVEIIVEKGTQTKDLYIKLEYPCALNLTFSTTVTSFALFPSVIIMNLGDLQSVFRVSVPVSLSEGTYYIIWITNGEQTPPLYTPLKKTKVIVTNLKNVPIDITEISNIPFGGSSLYITASMTYSPNIGIELVANLDSDYLGVSLIKKNIIFSAGDNTQTFELQYSNDSSITNGVTISKGGITIILSGVNKETYTLTTSHLNFVIIGANIDTPTLTELVISSLGQTYCQIDIGANEIVMAYYMVALTGTSTPNFTEVYNQGPIDYATTQKQYGAIYIGSSNRASITIKKLFAQTPYTIYIYLKNRGLNLNKIKTLDFQTKDRYPAAEFSLRILQAYLNTAEKNSTIYNIAFVLSMPPYHLQVKKYTFATRNLMNLDCHRNLSTSETVSTLLTLQIFSVTNSSNYPSPLNMAQLLRNKTSQLSSLVTNFDTSYEIPTQIFKIYLPSFVETPSVPVLDQFKITVKVKLDNYGYVYAIALNASQDKSKPSSFQIYNGFDSENKPISRGWIEISEAFTYFTFDITNLTPNTQYNIYLGAGSVHPGYPDLITDKSVVLVAVQTKPLIIFDPLDINFCGKMETTQLFLLFLVSMLILGY